VKREQEKETSTISMAIAHYQVLESLAEPPNKVPLDAVVRVLPNEKGVD